LRNIKLKRRRQHSRKKLESQKNQRKLDSKKLKLQETELKPLLQRTLKLTMSMLEKMKMLFC
jgi:hypothetical protein